MHDRVAVLDEKGEHVEHLRLDVDLLAVAEQLVTSRVQQAFGEPIPHGQILPARRATSAQMSNRQLR